MATALCPPIPPDDATKAVIADIITCLGADTDASGKPGVSQAKVDRFFAEAAAYSDWWKKAEGDAAVLPLGVNTEAASGAVQAVKAKVDDYFARGRLAAFRSALRQRVEPRREGIRRLERQRPDQHARRHRQPAAGASRATTPLPLTQGINPAWAGADCHAANSTPSCRCSAPGRC